MTALDEAHAHWVEQEAADEWLPIDDLPDIATYQPAA